MCRDQPDNEAMRTEPYNHVLRQKLYLDMYTGPCVLRYYDTLWAMRLWEPNLDRRYIWISILGPVFQHNINHVELNDKIYMQTLLNQHFKLCWWCGVCNVCDKHSWQTFSSPCVVMYYMPLYCKFQFLIHYFETVFLRSANWRTFLEYHMLHVKPSTKEANVWNFFHWT